MPAMLLITEPPKYCPRCGQRYEWDKSEWQAFMQGEIWECPACRSLAAVTGVDKLIEVGPSGLDDAVSDVADAIRREERGYVP